MAYVQVPHARPGEDGIARGLPFAVGYYSFQGPGRGMPYGFGAGPTLTAGATFGAAAAGSGSGLAPLVPAMYATAWEEWNARVGHFVPVKSDAELLSYLDGLVQKLRAEAFIAVTPAYARGFPIGLATEPVKDRADLERRSVALAMRVASPREAAILTALNGVLREKRSDLQPYSDVPSFLLGLTVFAAAMRAKYKLEVTRTEVAEAYLKVMQANPALGGRYLEVEIAKALGYKDAAALEEALKRECDDLIVKAIAAAERKDTLRARSYLQEARKCAKVSLVELEAQIGRILAGGGGGDAGGGGDTGGGAAAGTGAGTRAGVLVLAAVAAGVLLKRALRRGRGRAAAA